MIRFLRVATNFACLCEYETNTWLMVYSKERRRFTSQSASQNTESHSGEWPSYSISSAKLVGARGFEPPTSRSQTERTTRLCYAPSCSILREKTRHSSQRLKLWSSFAGIRIRCSTPGTDD